MGQEEDDIHWWRPRVGPMGRDVAGSTEQWRLPLECRGLWNEPCAGPPSKLGSVGTSGVRSPGLPCTDVLFPIINFEDNEMQLAE